MRKSSRKLQKLYWGQADWFFDQEGIGLHYRSQEISKDAKQLDIYFNQRTNTTSLESGYLSEYVLTGRSCKDK